MYHCVNSFKSKDSLVVSPESFTKQMDWLEKKSFRFLSLDEVVDSEGKTPLWDPSVAITFDDGFRDNYEKAFPALIRRKKNAALFVVVNWVGQNGFVGWKEIKELAKEGITIGSHSLTHRWLTRIADEKELEGEITDSKKKIEDQIGREVRHFSYPVGVVDERVAEKVKKAGYRAAWVAGTRPAAPVSDSFYCFQRVKVSPSDAMLLRFAVKAYGLKGLFQSKN